MDKRFKFYFQSLFKKQPFIEIKHGGNLERCNITKEFVAEVLYDMITFDDGEGVHLRFTSVSPEQRKQAIDFLRGITMLEESKHTDFLTFTPVTKAKGGRISSTKGK